MQTKKKTSLDLALEALERLPGRVQLPAPEESPSKKLVAGLPLLLILLMVAAHGSSRLILTGTPSTFQILATGKTYIPRGSYAGLKPPEPQRGISTGGYDTQVTMGTHDGSVGHLPLNPSDSLAFVFTAAPDAGTYTCEGSQNGVAWVPIACLNMRTVLRATEIVDPHVGDQFMVSAPWMVAFRLREHPGRKGEQAVVTYVASRMTLNYETLDQKTMNWR